MTLLALALEGVLLVGGTVHTQVEDEAGRLEAPRRADVWIEDDVIRAVGLDLDVPADVRKVDVSGLHLVPGLVDALAHHDPDHDALWTAAGITLVRDAGGELGRMLAARERSDRDRVPGPALVISGPLLDGAPPASVEALVLDSAEAVEQRLPRLIQAGVDALVYHETLPVEAWEHVVELAREHQVGVWGPPLDGVGLARFLAEGQAGLFGLEAFVEPADGAPSREPRAEPGPADERAPGTGPEPRPADESDAHQAELLARAAAAELAVVPLLAAYERALVDPRPDAEPTRAALELLAPEYEAAWRAELAGRRRWLDSPDAQEGGRAGVVARRAALRRLAAAGVPLVPGSGSPNPWLVPGEALHAELAAWVAAGLEPARVLHAATAGAAAALGLEAERGTLEPGRRADVLAVAGDPTAELGVLRAPVLVVVRGAVLERVALDARKADQRERQAARRAAADAPLEVAPLEPPEGDVLLSGRAETRALGRTISAERFVVVREPDGTLCYLGRVRTPGGASVADTELVCEQRFRGHKLESYSVRVTSAGREVVVSGRRVGTRHSVDQRVDGFFQGNVLTDAQLSAVDAGSATTALAVAQQRKPGDFHVLAFEGLAPAVANWTLAVDAQGRRLVRAHDGLHTLVFDADGTPRSVLRPRGRAAVETAFVEVDTPVGSGIALRWR